MASDKWQDGGKCPFSEGCPGHLFSTTLPGRVEYACHICGVREGMAEPVEGAGADDPSAIEMDLQVDHMKTPRVSGDSPPAVKKARKRKRDSTEDTSAKADR